MAQVLAGFPSTRYWIRFAHARLRYLFPYLLQPSGYIKRLNAVGPLISHVIQALARQVPTWCAQTAGANRSDTGSSPGCDRGSRPSSTPSMAVSAWSSTAAAPWRESSPGPASACLR